MIKGLKFIEMSITELCPLIGRVFQVTIYSSPLLHEDCCSADCMELTLSTAFYGALQLVARFMLAYSSCRIMMIIFHEGYEK